LAPLVHFLERHKLKRAPAVLLVVLFGFSVIGGIGYVVAIQLGDLSKNLPEYTTRIEGWIQRARTHHGAIDKVQDAMARLSRDVATSQPATTQAAASNVHPVTGERIPPGEVPKVEMVPPIPPALDLLYATFGPALEVLATAFIVIVLSIFMLINREDLRDRLIRLVSHGHLSVTTKALDEATYKVSRYLLAQAMLNGTYGILVATGLAIIGVPNPVLFGMLAGLLRFIPYVGPWLGAAIPVLLSFVILDPRHGFYTIGMYVTLELIVSSAVEPWLYGSHTGVSPVAILIAAVFWAWIWGGVGLLLATPLTVLLVVVGKYVPQMEFLAVMLGDEPVFDKPTSYYQRLLASDQEEAAELVEEYCRQMPTAQLYETVLIPTLGIMHRDRYQGRIEADRARFIRDAMKEQVEELGETPPPPPANAGDDAEIAQPTGIPGAEHVQVLCLPARDESDEIAGMMVAQLLERNGFKAEAVSVTALASEMMELVDKKRADIVVISALPPSAMSHAKYLCKRLHARFPQIKLLVGLWTSNGDLDRAKRRMTCVDGDVVVANFTDALHHIEQLAHPVVLNKEENTPTPRAAVGPKAHELPAGAR
jgi:predicted PurR-regulated permease PerM